MAWLTTTTGWDWAGLGADLLLYLGIAGPTAAQTVKLQALLLAALRAGDQYMGNPWSLSTSAETPYTLADYRRAATYDLAPTDGTDVTPPDDVLTGVFEWIAIEWARMHGDGLSPAPASPPMGTVLGSRKTDNLSEGYVLTSRPWLVGSAAGEGARFFPHIMWQPYKLEMFL